MKTILIIVASIVVIKVMDIGEQHCQNLTFSGKSNTQFRKRLHEVEKQVKQTNHQHTKSQQSKTMETRLHKKIENLEQIFLKFACIVGLGLVVTLIINIIVITSMCSKREAHQSQSQQTVNVTNDNRHELKSSSPRLARAENQSFMPISL